MLIRHLSRRSVFAAAQTQLKLLSPAALFLEHTLVLEPAQLSSFGSRPLGPSQSFQSVRGFAATSLVEPKPEESPSDVALTTEDARSILQVCNVSGRMAALRT